MNGSADIFSLEGKRAGHAYVLGNGEISMQGAGMDLLDHLHLRSTYLGL